MKAPVISSWFGRGQVEAPPDIASAALRSDRFRLEREGDWKRLEAILERMEKGGLRTVLSEAVFAAYRRTEELGRELEEQTAGDE